MANHAWQSFTDRIAWEGNVHVACETLEGPLDPARLARLEELNAGMLATLDLLGERSVGEASGDDANAVALARIDAKVDVLLALFNRHLADPTRIPPRRPVRFNTLGVFIEGWRPDAPDAPVLVRMHFDACIGLPLELPGRADHATHEQGGFIALGELPDGVRNGIEHLVFRQHRRQVAEARRESHQARR